ncbi:acetolactate synthase small subunit [Desulfovibrio sp. JC022]|uniref:acetolactate synthase small subunit n=1 Tax=Desulfovibrio sp. JC022 TaxID=2593642 RepID=UPI0013D58EA2|nr:acetolactate synthase small subunit [Desulfovibrio sp. JC022]NDV23726.1 acetolactate synthase small subunit [Desulfovibrio sp. JC022]
MKHTISALVRNKTGVLAESSAAFQDNKINITSISCGETENMEVSRMVICAEGSKDEITKVTEELKAMDFVIQLDDLARKEFVDRELVLIKVEVNKDTMSQIMQIFEVFRADVVGMGQKTITVELSGDQERVEGLIKILQPFGIKSLCRTGMIALKRGDE